MADTVLTRPSPSSPSSNGGAPAAVSISSPLQQMKGCIETARQLEEMAKEMDCRIKERDGHIERAEKEHRQRLTQAEQGHKTRLAVAGDERAAAKTRAATEKTRLFDLSHSTLTPFNADFSDESFVAENIAVPPETTATLAPRLAGQAGVLAGLSKQLDFYTKNFNSKNGGGIGCAAVIALLILYGLGAGILHSELAGLLFVLGVPALVFWHYWSQKSAFENARAQLVQSAMAFVKRAVWEYDQAAKQADAAYKSQEDASLSTFQAERQGLEKRRDKETGDIRSVAQQKLDAQSQRMLSLHNDLMRRIEALNSGLVCGRWNDAAWQEWKPAESLPGCLRLGTLEPQMPRFRHHLPKAAPVAIPALVDYEEGKGVVVLADNAIQESRQLAQSAITRLLATVPPAGVRFVFIDPVSLGGNVAGFMALEKFDANLIGGKAWSDARHIEQALAEITDHMETVIQKYLREDYKTIAQYNAKARVKEAYRVIVAFDFPVNFSETAAKRLVSIMRNGPRCGVFPFVLVDRSKPLPYGFNLADLQQFALVLQPAKA